MDQGSVIKFKMNFWLLLLLHNVAKLLRNFYIIVKPK